MRILLFFSCLLITSALIGQRNIPPTEAFKITGQVKMEQLVTIGQIDSMSSTPIDDQVIYNQKGEIKDTLTGLRGVPLKEVISRIQLVYDKPKELNEFYFVFTASDGYKVVFSWNEIYNTEAGNHFYILTRVNGKPLNIIEERIPLISTTDIQSGRRYIKGLQLIEVKRSE